MTSKRAVVGYEQQPQSHVTLWHAFARVTVGNPIVRQQETLSLWNHYAWQSLAAINDANWQPIWLKRGQYTVRIQWRRLTTNGIATISLKTAGGADTLWTKTLDMYGASALNQETVYTDLLLYRDSVSGFQWHIVTTAKNAASSGYYLPFTLFDFCRDAT